MQSLTINQPSKDATSKSRKDKSVSFNVSDRMGKGTITNVKDSVESLDDQSSIDLKDKASLAKSSNEQ